MSGEPELSTSRLRRTASWVAGLFALGGALFGFEIFIGAASGGLIALINFEAFARLVKNLASERPGKLAWLGVFGLLFRYILLCIALFVIIGVWHANVVSLALGFSAPVAAILVECAHYAYRESKQDLKKGSSDHDEA